MMAVVARFDRIVQKSYYNEKEVREKLKERKPWCLAALGAVAVAVAVAFS